MSSKSKGKNQNIQVFVRVRPSNASEVKSRSVVDVNSDREITVRDSKQTNSTKTFTFNNVFGPQSAQIDVYRSVVHPLIDEVLSGYNCTVFAYGQTGTGKTFTMEGERSPETNVSWENDPLAGIVPRTLSQLFDELRLLQVDFSVKVTFLELYNEELIDLLSPAEDTSKLRIFEDSTKKGAVIISGLEEATVTSKSDVYHILERGSLKRQTAATLMNAHSSRSHTVFTVTVHIRESANEGEEFMRTGKMNLVDLAGSENIGRSGAVEKRAREAGNINQSLLTLGRVITALVDHSPHIPYRESKLTRILQESLGGRTKTSIIATISPAACNLEETLSTLDYAHRAKNIQNKPEINQRVCKKTLLKEYSEEIERLQRDLEATRQRTGVYLDQAEYSGMMIRLEQLEVESKNKEQQMVALANELEKKQAICDELTNQTKAVEETLSERTAVKDKQENKLTELKSETLQVVTEITEKDQLILCHVETQERLTMQADTLLRTAVNSTSDLELLHDKIDRTRIAAQCNELSIKQFKNQNKEIIDQTKAVIEDNIQFMSEAVSALASSTNESLSGIKSHLNNAISTVEAFQGIPEKAILLSNSITSMTNFESKLQSGIDVLKTGFLQSFSDCKAEYSSQIHEGLLCAERDITGMEKLIEEIPLRVVVGCGTLQEHVQDWNSKRPHHFESFVRSFSDKVDNTVTVVDNSVNSKNTFHQKYLELAEKHKEKYDAILKLVSEIEAIDHDCEELVESHVQTVHENVNSVIMGMEDAGTYVRSALEEGKLEMNCVKKQLEQNIEDIPACLSRSIAELDYNSQLLPLGCLSQQDKRMRDTWQALESNVEELLKKDTESHEHLTRSCCSHAEEVLHDIVTAEEGIQNHILHHISGMEHLKNTVQKATENLTGRLESMRSPLEEKIEDYKMAVDHLQSFGAKAATPTGKTPQRSELSIPHDLASTSPHERILSRLRSKYRIMTKISPGDSTDSAYSDMDSDVSLSDIESLANKENTSLVEKERSEKSFIPTAQKTRKPLSQNN